MENLGQQESTAFRSAQNDVNNTKLGQLGTLASMTQPKFAQNSSSGSGNMTGQSNTAQWQTPGVGDYISQGLNIASLF